MTDDAKFTKGPWFAEKAFVYALNDQGTNRFFAGVQDAFTPKSELEANARLIAAAPELYEALYECATLLSALTGPDDAIASTVLSMAHDALAKAVSP